MPDAIPARTVMSPPALPSHARHAHGHRDADADPLAFRDAPLSALTREDRERFRRFGAGERMPAAYRCIHHAIAERAARAPDTMAVEHLGRRITYRQLQRRAEALARRLNQQGISRGDAVCLFASRGIELIVGIVATLECGAAYVPQDVCVAPAEQLEHIVRTSGSRIILTEARYRELLPSVPGVEVIAIDAQGEAAPLERRPPAPRPSAEDRCFILFTSGTTGVPNGVQVTHGNVCNILLTAPGNLAIGPGDRVAQLLSISFDMAAWEILGCLANGATLVIRGDDIEQAARTATVLIATPSVLARIDPDAAPRVRAVAVAGEPCPRPLADAWASRCDFHNACGPTETAIVNTMRVFRPGEPRLTIGGPTPNNTVYVLDTNLDPLPIGEIGEMWAGGDCVTAGYLDNATLTAERYRPDPFLGGERMMFRTRDLGRWTPDGALEHFGRTDDQVKIRGFRVELDAVSQALERASGCRRAVTMKLSDRDLVAVVTPATVDETEARARVRESLPYYCEPVVVLAVDELPSTDRGKIDKRALLARCRTAARKATRRIDTDTTCGANGTDGTDGTDSTNGTNGTNGTDRIADTSGIATDSSADVSPRERAMTEIGR